MIVNDSTVCKNLAVAQFRRLREQVKVMGRRAVFSRRVVRNMKAALSRRQQCAIAMVENRPAALDRDAHSAP